MIDPAPFGLFVRSVPGKVVPRYGQHGHYVGARRSTDAGRGWTWTDKIQALSKAEAARYRVEYQRAIRSGSLERCTAEDYASQAAIPARSGAYLSVDLSAAFPIVAGPEASQTDPNDTPKD